MFPSDAVYAEVYKLSPYTAETATIVTHAQDAVYTGQHGSEGLLTIKQVGSRLSKGLTASVVMAINPRSTPALIGATSNASTIAGQGGGTGGLGGATGGPPTRAGAPPTGTRGATTP
jgi:hypothetical protein